MSGERNANEHDIRERSVYIPLNESTRTTALPRTHAQSRLPHQSDRLLNRSLEAAVPKMNSTKSSANTFPAHQGPQENSHLRENKDGMPEKINYEQSYQLQQAVTVGEKAVEVWTSEEQRLAKQNQMLQEQLRQLQQDYIGLQDSKDANALELQTLKDEISVLRKRDQHANENRRALHAPGYSSLVVGHSNADEERNMNVPREFSMMNHDMLFDFEFEKQKLIAQKDYYIERSDALSRFNEDLQAELHHCRQEIERFQLQARKYALLKSIAIDCNCCSGAYRQAYHEQIQKPYLLQQQYAHPQSHSHDPNQKDFSPESNALICGGVPLSPRLPSFCRTVSREDQDRSNAITSHTHKVLQKSVSRDKSRDDTKKSVLACGSSASGSAHDTDDAGNHKKAAGKKTLIHALSWHGSKRSSVLKRETLEMSGQRRSVLLKKENSGFKKGACLRGSGAKLSNRLPTEVTIVSSASEVAPVEGDEARLCHQLHDYEDYDWHEDRVEEHARANDHRRPHKSFVPMAA